MVQQMHTAELRAKIKNLLAPEGLCHSELQVDASGEGDSLCPAGAREPPCACPADFWAVKSQSQLYDTTSRYTSALQ